MKNVKPLKLYLLHACSDLLRLGYGRHHSLLGDENTKSQDGLTWNTLIPLQTSEYKIINYQLYILRKGNTLEGS